MTNFPEPTDAQKDLLNRAYEWWCEDNQKDPDDQQAAREYEEWWRQKYMPHGEEPEWSQF